MSISYFLKKNFLKPTFFPAHNRGQALPSKLGKLLKMSPGYWDLPELPEIGSPTSINGLIPEVQREFAERFSTNSCYFGVNGASGLIQSAIIAIANPGQYILMPRNVHISVIKACALTNVIPIFFDLEFCELTGQFLPINENWFMKVLKHVNSREKELAGVILVNPSYQGLSANIEPIINICHDKNLPVLVDEAHGAYFLFCENFGLPKSAVQFKADLVIHSLHKSLNGLTQTAILWHQGSLINRNKLSKSIDLLQTTSPSSLLIASCEESIKDWLNNNSLDKYKKLILKAKSIFDDLEKKGIPLIKSQDPLKIILNTGKFGIDGFKADRFFYKKGLIAELPELMTLTFCLGFSIQDDFASLLERLWKELLSKTKIRKKITVLKPPFGFVDIPEVPIAYAWRRDSYELPLKESYGSISADIICPYPPGIPLIIPGERIDQKRLKWILSHREYFGDLLNSNIRVLKIK